MPLAADLPIAMLLAAFAVCAGIIAVAGVVVARRADVIADRTGIGEAMIGAVLMGGSTSLAGIVTSVTAAWQGHPSLAISNAVGGIAIQTAFLAVGDLAYRKANLEHAAASATVLSQGALLATLLAVPIAAYAGPDVTAWGVHPGTLLLLGLYALGLRLLAASRKRPMWLPRTTPSTVEDEPDPANDEDGAGAIPSGRLYRGFALMVLVLAVTGYALTQLGIVIADRTGLDETAVGGLLTATATSLPELVTTLAAVRAGALTLALGGVIGGNVFDTLFLAFSDVAYRGGSLYHRFGNQDLFVISLTILMTGMLLLGLLRRERQGPGGIGFESLSILILYGMAVAVVL